MNAPRHGEGLRLERSRASAQFKDGKFQNPTGASPAMKGSTWPVLGEFGVRFTATPSQHFSGRGLLSRNKTLWASWVIEAERRKVFFSGDTGLIPGFADVGREHGPFDLVMLEVGAYHPAWGTIHLGPENALTAFEMLGGGTLLPVHWGTFNLALHDWDEPAETLLSLATERRARIVTPQIGAAFEPEHMDAPTPWWRGVARSR